MKETNEMLDNIIADYKDALKNLEQAKGKTPNEINEIIKASPLKGKCCAVCMSQSGSCTTGAARCGDTCQRSSYM